jgi:hypothetical protein
LSLLSVNVIQERMFLFEIFSSSRERCHFIHL